MDRDTPIQNIAFFGGPRPVRVQRADRLNYSVKSMTTLQADE